MTGIIRPIAGIMDEAMRERTQRIFSGNPKPADQRQLTEMVEIRAELLFPTKKKLDRAKAYLESIGHPLTSSYDSTK